MELIQVAGTGSVPSPTPLVAVTVSNTIPVSDIVSGSGFDGVNDLVLVSFICFYNFYRVVGYELATASRPPRTECPSL